jgi:alpha/beta superfamily hydrolase
LFSGDDRLEGILEWPPGVAEAPPAGGVVIAHPHPLYGGTMAQPVVYRVAQACRARGFASLRFNFRGVGQSRGTYSGVEEYRDVEAAAAFLRGQLAAAQETEVPRRPAPIGVAGYSFGSVMAAVAAGAGTLPVQALALIALVVAWEEWPPGVLDGLARFRGPVLAVCGERDDLAPPETVERRLDGLGIDFELAVVSGAGHLFDNSQREVGDKVAAFFAANIVRRS